jgi:hypothetical protein
VWVGETLGPLERLCIMSGLAAGHPFHVYSYEPDRLKGVPDGAEVRDAAEIMPRARMTAYADCGSFSLGSNFWRYEMLSQGRGFWVDLDMLLLKPLDMDEDYVFGREPEGSINTAIMLAPPDSGLVRDLVDFPKSMRRPPWFGPVRSAKYYWKRVTSGPLTLEHFPWGTYGPQMLGYFVRKNGLERFAAEPEVYYPVSWHDVRILYGPGARVEELITDKTRAVHLYNSQLRDLAKSPPPADSFMARQFERLGMAFDETSAAPRKRALNPAPAKRDKGRSGLEDLNPAPLPAG